MMGNSFSIFDPSTSLVFFSTSVDTMHSSSSSFTVYFSTFTYFSSIFWMVITFFILFLFFPTKIFFVSYSFMKIVKKITSILMKEIGFTLGKMEKGIFVMMLLIFINIFIMNFFSLFCHILPLSSHLSLIFPLSLMFWLSMFLFSLYNNTNQLLTHLLPQGTPSPLMMFMVLIEIMSNLMRPVTLCIRLTANMIAGHLLMSLLNSTMIFFPFFYSFFIFIPVMLLTILEVMVSLVQSYVFVTLITLYMKELK